MVPHAATRIAFAGTWSVRLPACCRLESPLALRFTARMQDGERMVVLGFEPLLGSSLGDGVVLQFAGRAKRVCMPLFPLLLQSADSKTPPARAAVVAVLFVIASSFFVGDATAGILARLF